MEIMNETGEAKSIAHRLQAVIHNISLLFDFNGLFAPPARSDSAMISRIIRAGMVFRKAIFPAHGSCLILRQAFARRQRM